MHKYSQLINEIEYRIGHGEFKDGSKLPAIRQLAQQYGCSKSTVVSAYAELERRHIIYAIPKSGYYVVKQEHQSSYKGAEPMLDFMSASPDPTVFPYVDFQHCINKAIDMYQDELFQYGTPSGLPSLIKLLPKHLAEYQVFPGSNRICVTSGVQQAFAILAAMPFPNGRPIVLVEQPGYHLLNQLLEIYRVPARGIRRTAAGIDLAELERQFQTGDIKMFCTVPRFHNPLGTSYSTREKKAIAALAEAYDVYIVEDDYLADLEDDSKADPIYAYDRSSHVIYLKSYSKILFPGLRVGVAVVPAAIEETFNRHKKLLDIDSSMLSQAALEIYMKSGMFERHKQKIKSTYKRRMMRLNEALRQYVPSSRGGPVEYAPVVTGAHTHIALRAPLSVTALKDRLRKRRILLDSTEAYYLSGFPRESLIRLNISNVKEEQIGDGIGTIIAEIERLLRTRSTP